MRFDVAVDQTALMSMLQAQRRLPDVLTGQADLEHAPGLYQLVQVRPFDEFHDEKVSAVHLVGIKSTDDVGMFQLGGGADFAVKTLDGGRICESLLADELDGYDLSELPVAGFVDLPHAAFAQQFQ